MRLTLGQIMLRLADEHLDTILQASCNLAKHRRSDTLERKDIQIAYGMSSTAQWLSGKGLVWLTWFLQKTSSGARSLAFRPIKSGWISQNRPNDPL
jgi:hypothetical protein